MIIAAALAGALVMAGLVLLVAELTRRAPAPGVPPGPDSRRSPPRSAADRLGVLAGLVIPRRVTRWPVAAPAADRGRSSSRAEGDGKPCRGRRTAVLGLSEHWARRLSDC